MFTTLSTAQVRPADRLSYWIDAVCDTYVQLECDAPVAHGSIEGEIRRDSLATLQLSRVTGSAQTVRRTPAKIARCAEDYFLVSIQSAGRGVVVQDGRAAALGPGDFALYDSTRPYELLFDAPFQQFVLMLPGPVLRSQLRNAPELTARPVSGARGAGHLLIDMIRSLADDIDTLEPTSAAAVAAGVENILIAGLCSLPCARAGPKSDRTAFHLEQIRQYVRRHLRDPLLSVGRIAADLRISVSTVHRVFANESSSVSDWIWAQRLDGVRRELCDPALRARGVGDLAFAWGFNDAAHFSRAFRARFGCSPRELREACFQAGAAASASLAATRRDSRAQPASTSS